MALGSPDMGLHNRLTHSLKVEQVGLSIHSCMSNAGDDLDDHADGDAIAAACLAHDIGHPPFGHAGELELNSLVVCPAHLENPRTLKRRLEDPCAKCILEDGFEGNAQTFRILAVLAVHRGDDSEPYGLDLTRATLRAVSKYPWPRGGLKPKKWGAYDCDVGILRWVTGQEASRPNVDAQIMDWADDISYAVHDIEDFFRAGIIPIDDYRPARDTLKTFLRYVQSERVLGPVGEDEMVAFEQMLEFFPSARFSGATADVAKLDNLRSILLTQFINGARFDGTIVVLDSIQEKVNAILKQLIWYHVIDDPRLSNIQTGQRRVLREIFQEYMPAIEKAYGSGGDQDPDEQQLRRLPSSLRRAIVLGRRQVDSTGATKSHYTLRQTLARGLLDYISGLSDAEAYRIHAVLKGREWAGSL